MNVIVPLYGIGIAPKVIKAILIAGTFDLPAHCLVSGTTQFSQRHGCIKGNQEGKSCKTAKGGNVWICPYKTSKPKAICRSHEDTKNMLKSF